MRLLFLLLFIGLNAFSQKINLGDMSGYQNSSLDTLRQEFNIYFDDHLLTIDLLNYEKRITPLVLQEGLLPGAKYLSHTPVWVESDLYFLHGSGGIVYTIQSDTIKRIDRSFSHRMQYGANVFEHDNTAFKYGGYGFWSDRDFFTYYDKKQDEWEVYHPITSEIIPEGRSYAYYIKYKNLFHVFGGATTNPNNRREKFNRNEVWTFDFAANQWHFLGKHNEIEVPMISVPYKNKLVLVKTNNVTVIDVEANSKTVYKHSPISAQTNGIRYIHHGGDKFYVVLGNVTGTYLNIVEEADFFGNIEKETPFYKNQDYWLKQGAIYSLVITLIILILWFLKKKFVDRNKIKLLDNGLRYHLKFTEFDNESMKIIKLLLAEKEVPSSSILRIVEKEQYSAAHNERIKVQKINDINLKVATLLGIKEDLIMNFKSSNDRRIRLYKISKEHFNLKGFSNLIPKI